MMLDILYGLINGGFMRLNDSELRSIKSLLRSAADQLYDALAIVHAANSPAHIVRLTMLRRHLLNEIEDLMRESAKAEKEP